MNWLNIAIREGVRHDVTTVTGKYFFSGLGQGGNRCGIARLGMEQPQLR
jgi:hypothetical protein